MVEEKECLEINRRLKEYEKSLKSIFKEKNYCEIIADGTTITELMLEVISRRNDWPSNDIKTNLPIKAKNPLIEIDRLNEKIDKENVNYKKTRKFLKSFKRFVEWFNNDDDFACDADNCINLIESLPNTEPAVNTKSEGIEYIDEINESLENLEKHLELISKENFAGAVIEGYYACNLMLELFLKNESYTVDNGMVIQDNEKIPVITFCAQKDIFPKECREFLNAIYEYKNVFKSNDSYDLALSFLKGLNYFLVWFNDFYSNKYSINKPFKIENCYVTINELTYIQKGEDVTFKSHPSRTKKQKTEITNGDLQTLPIYSPNNDESALSSEIEEIVRNAMKKESEKIISTIQEKHEIVMNTLSDIQREIKNISQKITDYKSLIVRLDTKFNLSDEVKDNLIAAFADECAEKIVKQTSLLRDDDSYNLEKTNIKESIGYDAWSKLSEESKTYLISSKLMFNNLEGMSDVDYSGVCILVTKTLEVELFKRFYENFFEYLNTKYNRKYRNYPTGLLYKNRWPLNPEKFNLGTISYIFCLKEDNSIDYLQEQNNKNKLIEFCKADVFKGCERPEIERMIEKYGSELDEIRENYRNPSAHRDNIDKDKAKECLKLVLCNDDNLLKEMLGSFNE